MARPPGIYGTDAPYLASTGQALYDTPLASLPPVTRAVRAAFDNATTPVPSADVIAALLVAINALEVRLVALNG